MEEQVQGQQITGGQQGVAPVMPKSVPRRSPLFFLWILIGVLLFGFLGWFSYQQLFIFNTTKLPDQATLTSLPTYFSYTSDELQSLRNIKRPEKQTKVDDLRHWDEEAYAVVAKNETIDPSKFYTYLLVARRDALLLTRSMYKDFYGDTSAVSKKILCEFYPSDCQSVAIQETDAFSEKLVDIIMQKVKKRIAEDAAQTRNYVLKDDPKYWYLSPQIGLDAGSYKPWLIEKGDQFRVPENPDFAIQKFDTQLALVKTALANITSEQRKAVIFWAGGPGTKTPPGIWLDIAGEYMIEKEIAVETYLETQALLSMAMTDSLTSCFDSKYTYLVKRPYMVDPTIKTVMPTPNHPSYPAGHACVSNAAATILVSKLPEHSDEWQRLAKEASDSRVWGGIHYPADNEQGTLLGKRVGEFALTHFRQ